jgi:hypothetical protein
MRPIIIICISFALTSAMARAEKGCGLLGPDNPCELAKQYAAFGQSQLPQTFEEFEVAITMDTAIAEDEKLIVRGSTALTKAQVVDVLADHNQDSSSLQLMLDTFLVDGVCNTNEGPHFVNSGGQVVVILVSADGKTLARGAVQSCPGGS